MIISRFQPGQPLGGKGVQGMTSGPGGGNVTLPIQVALPAQGTIATLTNLAPQTILQGANLQGILKVLQSFYKTNKDYIISFGTYLSRYNGT